jgi:hypothetical protein
LRLDCEVAESDRVLYTYGVDELVKEAVIVHHGSNVEGSVGWYVESWAACDPAEFPDSVIDLYGLQIWADAAGRRVLDRHRLPPG